MIALLISPFLGIGQDANLVGQAAQMVINEGTQVVVGGHIVMEEDFSFANEGLIALSGDLANYSSTAGTMGSVVMNGEDQMVEGSVDTYFGRLAMTGEGFKTFATGAIVSDHLDLQNAIVETQSNIVHVSNPDIDALTWDQGFVQSSTLGGALARSTNSSSIYPFPVGNESLQDQYRAIDITPTNSDSAVFLVRLAAVNATFDRGTSPAGIQGPFDLMEQPGTGSGLNNQYYHNIYQSFGSGGADIDLYYFNYDYDGEEFNEVRKWLADERRWDNAEFNFSPAPLIAEFGDPDMVASARISEFTSDSYVLGYIPEFLVPEVFSPNGDGINDAFYIRNIEDYPKSRLEIFNRWGNKVYTVNNYRNDWEGTFKDSPLPSGTYFYFLDFGTDEDLPPMVSQRVLKGFFEIKR